MAANLQQSAVRDTLSQFREPWALFQRHGPVQFYITKDARSCNQLRALFTRLCGTPLPEAVHVITDSLRSLAATKVAAAC